MDPRRRPGRISPVLGRGPGLVQDFYWSATTSAYDPCYVWGPYTRDGVVGVGYKPLKEFYFWPVR
ncbi:MAG TPA: DUF1566 domain-containing protein [Desulfobacteraceae bacterium]|nr:DUF1566 domain-containing protein [Desulfobacteraceae bacterium]